VPEAPFDVGALTQDGLHYQFIVMEYVQGKSLRSEATKEPRVAVWIAPLMAQSQSRHVAE
jgi:hypothetical protein